MAPSVIVRNAVTAAGWCAGAATRRGADHAATNSPCADKAALRHLGRGRVIAALADGAGSAAEGAAGAHLAVGAALDQLESDFGGTSAATAELETLGVRALTAAAAALEGPWHACTLILCVLLPDRLLAAQVGDGFAVVRRQGEPAYRRAVAGWKGEHINETPFLTDPDWADHARVSVITAPAFICLASDGLEHLAIRRADDAPHGGFFRPLEDFLASRPDRPEDELAAFLSAPETTARTHDDLSLMAAALA